MKTPSEAANEIANDGQIVSRKRLIGKGVEPKAAREYAQWLHSGRADAAAHQSLLASLARRSGSGLL